MITLAVTPGTFPHSLRIAFLLTWNDVKQGMRKHLAAGGWRARLLQAAGAGFGLFFFGGLHLAAFALVTYTALSPSRDLAGLMAGLSTSIWCFLLFVMISGGLVRALVVLHEQDDSSLLLSSPAAPRAILAARLFGNALQSCLVDGFIIVPYIDVRLFVLGVHLNFLWGFAVWFALAVIVTCLDGLFSFGLVRWLGLRRARTMAQAVPFVLIFGVTFFAGSLSLSIAQMSMTSDQAHMPPGMQDHFIALAQTPLAWIAYAAAGRALPLLTIFAGAALLAFITLRLTERAFLEGTQLLSENEAPTAPGRDAPFRSSLLQLEIEKSVRLVLRTPMMIVQCLAQVLTPVGVAFVLGRDDLARGVSFFVIFAAGVLAGILTIAAGTVEECEDLLIMAPRTFRLFRYGKILSGFLAPGLLCVIVALGLALTGNDLDALAVFFGGVPLALASSIVGETFATAVIPGVRPKLLSDPIMMIPLLGLQITSGLVAGATVFSAVFSLPFLLAALGASYFILVLLVGLAQLRKPLF
jgi:hypothetical protein